MPNIAWSDQLYIGNPKIDDEHKQLIRIANSLLRAMKEGRSKNDFAKILHDLREYTVFHFTNEEEFMRSVGYPDLNRHVDQHNQLKKKVKDFQYAIFHGEEVVHEQVRDLLKEWLVGHILECDLKIKAYVGGQGSRGDA